MASARTDRDRIELLQGTLDLIVLRALSTMGPQPAYGLAARLAQVADHAFPLNQGTLYAALVRLEQKGWIKGSWQRTEHNREAKYYAITKPGTRALGEQTGEMAAHLRQIEDDYIRRGMSAPDARVAALRAFGGVDQAKEVHRDTR